MRVSRSGLFVSLLLLGAPIWAQQASTPQTQSIAPKDSQAVTVVGQALAVAGGKTAIIAIADYTASGTVVIHGDQDIQGTVTVRGLGFGAFRLDVTLPSGARSFSIGNSGVVAAKNETGFVRNLNFNYQAPLMKSSEIIPCWQLAAALNDPIYAVSFKGMTAIDGYTLYDIRVQHMPTRAPDTNGVIAEYFGADFFIDATTYQVRMTQDVVGQHFGRKIRYANYTPANGVLVPFLIDEEINGRRTQSIQLQQIGFNTGLQDSDFQL